MENTKGTIDLAPPDHIKAMQVHDPERWYGIGPAGPVRLLLQTSTLALIVDANGAIFEMNLDEQPHTLRLVRIKPDQPGEE